MRLARPQPHYLSSQVTRIFGNVPVVTTPVSERRFQEPGMQRGRTITVFSMSDFTRGLFLRVARFKASSEGQ